jgi:hypothetical protein
MHLCHAPTTQKSAPHAPLNLKRPPSSGGDLLSITKDPSAPRGILVNGYKITLHDHATSDRKALLNSLGARAGPPGFAWGGLAWLMFDRPCSRVRPLAAAPAAADNRAGDAGAIGCRPSRHPPPRPDPSLARLQTVC